MTCSQCVSQAACNQLVQVAYHLSGDQAIIHLFVYTNNRFYSNLNLTLPVRRYLVPTSSVGRGDGGVQPTPIDLEKGRLSTTFNFGSPLGLSIRGKKKTTGRGDDLSLVRLPWQLIYVRVFSTKF